MAYGYIAELPEGVEREHVRFDNRYRIAIAGDLYYEKDIDKGAGHIDLYDRADRIPFDKLEAFFKENL